MPKGGTYEYTAKLLVSAGIDEKSIKEVVQQEKRLAKLVKEEFESAFKNFGSVINDALAKVNLKPIPLDDILDVSDIMGTMGKLGDHIREEVVSGLKGATTSGIDISDIIADNLDFSDELAKLKQQRKELTEEYEAIQKTIKNKTEIERINRQDISLPFKASVDIKSEAEKIRKEFLDAYDHIYDFEEEDEGYSKALLDAQEKANKMRQMYNTLNQSKDSGLADERSAYKKILNDEMSPIFDVEERFTDFSDEIIDATANLQQVRAELEKVNAEIDSITKKAQTTEGSALKEAIGDAKDLEAALERIKNKKGDTYNKTKIKKIDALLGDETPEIEDSLKSLKFGYDKAVAEGQGWEEEYQWLIKFIRKYDQLKAEGKQPKQLLKFEDTYNSFMQQYPEAMQALKELRTLVDNTPITEKPDKPVDNLTTEQPDGGTTDDVDRINKSLTEQENLLANIRKLTSYIDEEYLSAGKHLSNFLDDLQNESNELDGELKEVLSTLRLIDENGKPTFDIRQNGEDGGGTTHSGALISDDFVLIERGNYENVKDGQLPTATQGAYADGANVARVLDYIPSKYNGGFFDIQTKAHGKNLFKNGVISEDVVNATEEQLQQLVNAFIVAREHGFDIENGGSNIVYDEKEGFSFYDLEEWAQEDKDYWNSLSEDEKRIRALEDALSIFNGENRDHTDFDNDPNIKGFADKIKQAIGKDAQFKGLNYEDVFDEVFADYGDVDSELEDELNRMLADAQATKEKADARRAELVAQLDSHSGDVLTAGEADNNLQKREEILQTLKNEGLLTEELENSYNEINQKLEARANLLRQAEGYYDDVDGVLGDQRVDSIDSADQYRKGHIKPFDDTISSMRDSGLFSDDELNKFEQISQSMENRANQLPFDELSNLHVDPDDISNLKELNELLERRQKIMQTAGDTVMQQHDSNQYEEELKINQAIEERIALLKKANEDGAGGSTGTGTGTGDASSDELERLQQENKELLSKVEYAENDANYYYSRMRDAEDEANAADKRANEAEDELARIKADVDGKKLVDKDAPDADASKEFADMQTLQQAVEEVTAAVKIKTEAFDAERVAVSAAVADEIGELDKLTGKLKEVQDLLQNIQTGKIGTGGNITIDVGAQLTASDLATESTLSSVLGAVNSIDGKVTKGSQSIKKDDTQSTNATQKKNKTFDLDKDIAIRDFLKLRAELSTSGDLKGRRNTKVNSLWSQLEGVADSAGLSEWRKEFQKYQKGLDISSVFDKAYQSADKATYEQLIALKKTEYDLETKMLKAKGPVEKSVYESQLNAIRELISQQKILHQNMEYENKLAQMQENHNANIAAIKGKQVDSENAKRQKQEEKEVVRELVGLYEQLGRARTQGDATEYARLKGEIKIERGKLSNVDYDTDMKFKHATEKGSDAVVKEQENAALKEQKQIISELIALYKQLGQVDAKTDFATNSNEWAKFATESQEIQEQIKLKEKLISVDSKLRGKFDDAWESGVNKEAESELKKLSKKYEELGKLRAEIAAAPKGEYRSGLESELIVLEDSIEADKQRLHVNQELITTYQQVANAAEKVAQVELQRKKNKTLDKDAAALEQSLANEELKARQREVAASIKLQRKMAGMGDADSALNTGRKSLLSTYKMDGLSADAISQLPAVEKLTQALKELQDVRSKVPKDGNISKNLADELQRATQEVLKHSDAVKDLIKNYEKFNSDNAIDFGTTLDVDGDVKQQLIDATRQMYGNKVSFKEFNEETKEATFNLKGANREVTELTVGINQADNKIKGLKGSTKRAEGFFEAMGRKAKEIASYISVMDVYYKASEWLRQGIQYVRDIDSALTELKKVTDETAESYDRFLDKASKTGARIGSTISDYTNATATFAKLGYDMDMASGMAEAALVYQNVGDGVASAEAAAESIISTMKGFGLEASNAMAIVDRFNEVGNNFSITSTGIGEALTRSASALAEGGNSLDESIGLITAANEVVQDPTSVGTALKTLTLRLRGAKTELEEAGLEAENMATTTSSLRAKLLALTDGKVDIMLDEDTFKNSTQILREMAQVWEEMTDIEQAAALELMGGKRQANILSSIISNFDTVEEVIQSSANSSGSALAENEKILNSIEGKIRQFTNALQTMWKNALDDGVIKGFVEFGTILIKGIDSIGLFKLLIGSLITIPFARWIIQGATGLSGYGEALRYVGLRLIEVSGSNKFLGDEIANIVKTTWDGSTAMKGLGSSIKIAGKSLKAFLNTPLGKLALMAAAISAVMWVYDKLTTTLEEQKEKFTEINNKVQSTELELENLQTQLEEINTQIETLNSQDSLSFTEKEELERLEAQSDELERQIELTQTLKEAQQKELNNEAIATAEMYQDANFETGKGKGEYKQTGATIGAVAGSAIGLKGGMAAGTAAGASITAALTAAGTVAPGVGNAIGFIVGTLITAAITAGGAAIGAGIGEGVGGVVADSQEQVGESIDNMTTKYAELKQAHEAARQAYMDNPTDEGIKEDYEEAEKALTDYQGAMSTRLSEMQSYYDSIDLSVYDPVEDAAKIKQLRDEMDDFYDTQDKWVIQMGGKDAKVNAINRIFGENAADELKEVKKTLETTAKAGGEIDLEEAFSTAGLSTADLDAFIVRLHNMGIYVHEVEESFKQMAAAKEDAMSTDMYDSSKAVGSVKTGVESVTEALATAKKEGYLTAEALDEIAETLGGAENLGDAWTHFAEVMSTNTSTLKEQREAAEALVETYLDNNLMNGGHLTAEQQGVYITQLEDMGIWNAREYVQDKDMENMYKEIQNSADYDWDVVQAGWTKVQENWENGSEETISKLTAAGINEKKAWENLTSEQKDVIAEAIGQFKKVDPRDIGRISEEYGYELPAYVKLADDAPQEIKNELDALGAGGNVDISIRPQIDTSDLNAVGWDAGQGLATVFSSTISNTDFEDLMPERIEDTIALNFTPIIVDPETGNYMGVMSEKQLYAYAHDVIAGVREDDLHLQIGASFNGENAITDAAEAANRVHEIHEEYFVNDGSAVQRVVDLMTARNQLETKYQKLSHTEKAVQGKDKEIKRVDKLISAYEKLNKYLPDSNGLEDGGLAIQWGQVFKNADNAESYLNNVKSMGVKINASDEDFISAFNAGQALFKDMQKKFPDVDLSSLDKIKEYKKKLEDEKIKLQIEYDNAGAEEAKEQLQSQIEEIDKIIEAFTPDINIRFSFDIEQVKSDIETVKAAISESMSVTGMSADSVKGITAIFGELDNFDASKVFEKTASGIHLNAKAFRELNAEYEEANKNTIDEKLRSDTKAYNDLTEKINNAKDGQIDFNDVVMQANLATEIEETRTLASQYEALTSSYQKWIDAQSAGNERDQYASVKSGYDNITDLVKRGWITDDEVRHFTDFLSADDLSTAGYEEIMSAYNKLDDKIKGSKYSILDFFTVDSEGKETTDGIFNFFDTVNSTLGDGFASVTDGKYSFDFTGAKEKVAEQLGVDASIFKSDDEAVARLLGMDPEALTALLKGAIDAGFEVDLSTIEGNVELLENKLNKAKAALSKEGIEIDLTADGEALDQQIIDVQNYLNTLKDADGNLDLSVEGNQEVALILDTLLQKRQQLEQPAIMSVYIPENATGFEQIVQKMRELKFAYDELQRSQLIGDTAGVDAASTKIGELSTEIQELSKADGVDIPVGIKINEESLSSENLTNMLAGLTQSVGVDGAVTYTYDASLVDAYKSEDHDIPDAEIKYKGVETQQLKNFKKKNHDITGAKIKYTYEYTNSPSPKKEGDGEARGTAFASGTAFARGNWGTSKSGTALGGELGQEIVVRDGRWFTIGDNGAEFFHYKKDDIIFNAEQSRQILEKGKITTGNRRGKALVGGTAFAEGTAFSTGSGPSRTTSNTYRGQAASNSTQSSSKNKSSSSSDDDKRLEELRKRYEGIISNLQSQITMLDNEVTWLEETGRGVSEQYYDEKIEANELLIGQYAAEKKELLELQKSYDPGSEKWFEVADALWEVDHAIQQSTLDMVEARKAIIDLYKTAFDNIGDIYDSKVGISDDRIENMESYAEYLDLIGETPTLGLYDQIIAEIDTKIATLDESIAEGEKIAQALYARRDQYDVNSDEWIYWNQQAIAVDEELRADKNERASARNEREQKRNERKELATQRWDDVQKAYENRDQYYDNQMSLIDSYISRLDTLGIDTPDELIEEQIKSQQTANDSKWEQYLQARKQMIEYEKIYGADSQEYIDKENETIALHQEWQEGYNKVLENQQKIIDNQWDKYDQVMDRVDDAIGDLQNISDLIEDEDVATEDGEWTDEGLTRLGMAYQQMEYNKQMAASYAEEMVNLTEQYERGEISEKKYYERMQELEDAQWSAINAYEDQKDVIVEINEARIDMIEEGLDKEIEAYEELIDLKKEELDAERELYDFRNDVEDQEKNISSLERRIASMSGSTDAATIAERTKLEGELRGAKKDLDDSYRDYAYDSMSNALDDELDAYTKSSEDYIKSLRESIEDADLLVEQTATAVLENGTRVLETLTILSSEYGFNIDKNLTSPWENAELKASDFETSAKNHWDNIYYYVNSENSNMQRALGQPFYNLTQDKDGNPLYEYSAYTAEQITKIITNAEANQEAMSSALSGGFEQSEQAIQGWGSRTSQAIQNVIDKFTDPENGLLAAIGKTSDMDSYMPKYGGDGAFAVKTTSSGSSNNGSSSSSSSNSGTSLSYNANVAALQEVLNGVFGLNIGVDGKYGPATKQAVKTAQYYMNHDAYSSSWVTEDGLYGLGTRNAIIKTIEGKIQDYRNDNSGSSAVGQGIQRLTELKNKLPAAMYAKGTMGTNKDQWAITDESWIGEEITLAAGKNGQLQYLKKGSAVMPADISANLVEWGKLNPNMMGIADGAVNLNMISNAVNSPSFEFNFDSMVHVDNCSQDTLKDLERMVDTKINQFNKQLNQSLRRFK